MRKKTPKAYLFLFCSFLALMSIPKESTMKLQGTTVAMLSPTWQQLLAFKSYFSENQAEKNHHSISSEEVEKLRLENTLLREEILQLKNVMQQELKLIDRINASLISENETSPSTKSLKARHRQELQKLLQITLESVPAKIIFRSPDSWNSSFWINVGSSTNDELGNQTIAKNSPVLLGTSVIGVIDYVGKRQSRVRLITDSGLTPSIRAARGGIQTKILEEKLYSLINLLNLAPGVITPPEQQEKLIQSLQEASKYLSPDDSTQYLAKGEFYGTSKPLWRTQRHQLKGVGFNYDFADGEGPARDLRTGVTSNQDHDESVVPILNAGDILVTTGMDGIFPPGLIVAEVTQIHPLKEGDYYYELEALPAAGNFDDLTLVFVIPPINYDPEEQPFTWK